MRNTFYFPGRMPRHSRNPSDSARVDIVFTRDLPNRYSRPIVAGNRRVITAALKYIRVHTRRVAGSPPYIANGLYRYTVLNRYGNAFHTFRIQIGNGLPLVVL
jgi:hypothetical protein